MAREWTPEERREQARRLRQFYSEHPKAKDEARQRALDYYASVAGRRTILQLQRHAALRNEIVETVTQAMAAGESVLDLRELKAHLDRVIRK